MNQFFVTALGLAMSAGMAQAAIVVQNTNFAAAKLNVNTHTISGFSLSGGTKLVVTTGTENGNAASITFGGQALTSIVSVTDSNVQFASIWYLDNPLASSGNIVVTYQTGATPSSGISALSISGATSGYLDFSSAAGRNSGTLTIDVGSLVVGSFSANADTGNLINPDNPSTDVFSANIDGAAGGNAASAYFIEPDPAVRTSFGYIGGSNRPVAAAVSFAAIPEPASSMLLMAGAAGLGLLRRNRKR